MKRTIVWFRRDLRISDRFESEVRCAQEEVRSLFPAALDLDSLDLAQSQALRSWLVAHVNITARKSPHGEGEKRKSKRVTKPIPECDGEQLGFLASLLELE